jgi:hypothetical protein
LGTRGARWFHPKIHGGVGHGCTLSEGVNNLPTFAIEKKARRKTGMFNLKFNIKSIIF